MLSPCLRGMPPACPLNFSGGSIATRPCRPTVIPPSRSRRKLMRIWPGCRTDLARSPRNPCTDAARIRHDCRRNSKALATSLRDGSSRIQATASFLEVTATLGNGRMKKLRAGYVPRGTQPARFPSLLRRFSSGRSCLALRSYSASSSRSSSSSRYFSSISSSSYWSASLRPLMKLGASPM